jgi:type III secretory pathway lipoprotein EscJ
VVRKVFDDVKYDRVSVVLVNAVKALEEKIQRLGAMLPVSEPYTEFSVLP